tara:strand:+ start:109 stop:414 length:306 start_codon:yes stop_codon:yes gene_type:complete
MKVSELKPGMLIRPKERCTMQILRLFDVDCVVCHVRDFHWWNKSKRRNNKKYTKREVIIYVGKKEKSSDNVYEYRHEVFVPSAGMNARVASECWRNFEPVE